MCQESYWNVSYGSRSVQEKESLFNYLIVPFICQFGQFRTRLHWLARTLRANMSNPISQVYYSNQSPPLYYLQT